MEDEFKIAVASDDWEVLNSDGLDNTFDLAFDELEIDAVENCIGMVIISKQAEKLRQLLEEKPWLRGRHVIIHGMGKLSRDDIEKLANPEPPHWILGETVKNTKAALNAILDGIRQIKRAVGILEERKHHYYVLFHDVQNELLVPRGYVQLLGRKCFEGAEGDYLKSAELGLEYTANVLSRIPAIMEGVLVPDTEIIPVSIDRIITDTIGDGTDVIVSGTEKLLVLGTEHGIKFIVGELIRNARKYGASDIEIYREYAGAVVNITVVNTAVTIKESKFASGMTRMDPKSGGHGRGLGLPVINSIASRLGGRVKYLVDQEGKTVTLSVSLPGMQEL